jgi:hypothetical protein
MAKAKTPRARRDPDAEFNTPEKAYAEAERLIAEAQRSNAKELRVRLRFLASLPPSIATLTRLTKLSVTGSGVRDLSPLAALTGLTALWITDSPVSDLTPLTTLTRLTYLTLDDTPVSNLTPLAKLTTLTKLRLAGTLISDLTQLATLTGLNMLSLTGAQVRDLSPLAALTGLTTLWLDHTSVSELRPLAGLTSLTTLSFDETRVNDLTIVAKMTALSDAAAKETDDTLLDYYGLRFTDTAITLRAPFGALARLKNPARTVETINYVRRQQGLADYWPDGYQRPEGFEDILRGGTEPGEDERLPDAKSVPEQTSLGLHYGGPNDQPIQLVPEPPRGPLRDTPDQQALFSEIERRAGQLHGVCADSNSLGDLKDELTRLRAAMGSSISDLQPGLSAFWFALDRIREIDLEETTERAKKDRFTQEMPSGAYSLVRLLAKRLNEFVVGEPQLSARDWSTLGPDARLATPQSIESTHKYIAALMDRSNALSAGFTESARSSLIDARKHQESRSTPRAEEYEVRSAANSATELTRRATTELAENDARQKQVPSAPPAKKAGNGLSKGIATQAANWVGGTIVAGMFVKAVVEYQVLLLDLADALGPTFGPALRAAIEKIIEFAPRFY